MGNKQAICILPVPTQMPSLHQAADLYRPSMILHLHIIIAWCSQITVEFVLGVVDRLLLIKQLTF